MAVEDHSDEDKTVFAVARSDFKRSDPSFGGDPDKDSSNEDEDLTSLAWLQDTNLLRNFRMGTYGIEGDGGEDSPSSDCLDEAGEHVTVVVAEDEEEEECEQNVEPLPQAHSPYDPSLHSHSKPPFSFSCLIFMAIEDSPRKALPVKDIYGWILERFPYFQGAPTGWKNSVRHNLSLSKCFRKVDKEKGQNVGKGSLWCIDPEFRPNLLQALQKAPSMANLEFSHFSCSPSSPFYHNGRASESEIKPCLLVASQEAIQIPSPELFPFLSRRLASSMKDPEVDAAATMLTLKNGPAHTLQNISEESENDSLQNNPKFMRKRLRLKQPPHPGGAKKVRMSHQKPVITSSPSEDHTYSACLGDSSGGGGRQNGGDPPLNNAEEEGAHALMNLAEIASKRLLRKAPTSS